MKNGRTSAQTSQKRRQEPSRMLSGGRYVLITGGSGFVGANLAHRLLSSGERVVVYDNLSRAGVGQNYEWLLAEYGNDVALVHADTRDADRLAEAVRGASAVFHFAAQVAVTTSLLAPREDFEIN
ncbi:MAG TPA: GDP-mannose 4,6-dehydratase, partial [Chthoniobacteraceae bacterium]|nr:GDP-mannose 4,6-dehydratase [Chthoniobacteraceae bacterium]